MSMIQRRGKRITVYPNKKASTAITANSLLEWATGVAQPATAGTLFFIGQALETITSTDADYATARRTPVALAHDEAEFEFDVTGTLLTTMEGSYFDMASALTVDCTASARKQVILTKYLSATKGIFALNSSYVYKNAA